VRWVGSSTKMEQDAPAASGKNEAWFLIDMLVHGELQIKHRYGDTLIRIALIYTSEFDIKFVLGESLWLAIPFLK